MFSLLAECEVDGVPVAWFFPLREKSSRVLGGGGSGKIVFSTCFPVLGIIRILLLEVSEYWGNSEVQTKLLFTLHAF